jgi:hypothetical protein
MNGDDIRWMLEHYDLTNPPELSNATDEQRNEWYDVYYRVQGGLCAICKCKASDKRNKRKGVFPDRGPRFDFDHDSVTGKMRGLLCHSCNMGLGEFDHHIGYLTKAIEYLLGKHTEASAL